MTFLMVHGERYALQPGETTLGGDADELLRDSPLATLPPVAVITWNDDVTTIRALPSPVAVMLRGRLVGAESQVLVHGDVLTVGPLTLHVGHLGSAGRTDHQEGITDAQLAAGDVLPGGEPTAPTGGRLTSLSEGRSYDVPDGGLVLGRDPDCGVVLTARTVSRRHARVVPGLLGYSLVADSANGVVLNGALTTGSQLLSQGDVIGIGEDAFRFTADSATYEPDADVYAAPSTPLRAPTPATAPSDAMQTESRPAAQRPSNDAPAGILLATLEVRGGSLPAGTRFRVERPVVQIGRGAQNDIRLSDDSVSGTHATLLQRGSAWQILDLGSRNGTYVEGQRVTECMLPGVCELKLGTVSLLFRPLRAAAPDTVGTLAVIGIRDDTPGHP